MDKFEQALIIAMGDLLRENGDALVVDMQQRGSAHAHRLARFEQMLLQLATLVSEERQRFRGYLREDKQEGQQQLRGQRERALEQLRAKSNSGAEQRDGPAA